METPLLVNIGVVLVMLGAICFRVRRARFWTKKGIPANARVTKAINSGVRGYSSLSFSFPYNGTSFSSSGFVWDLYLEIEQPGLPDRPLNVYHRFKDGFGDP